MPSGRSVFYLDDDASQLAQFLASFGREYDVRTSSDISEALGMLAACSADIIISDQSLSGAGGTDFLNAASQVCPGSVRVLLSGRVTIGEVYPHVSSGVVHLFVSKPWDEVEMRRALERAGAMLGGRRRGGEG